MKKILFLIFLYCSSALFAECNVEWEIMESIMKNEAHGKRKVGYPFIISFNEPNDVRRAYNALQPYFIDNRSIDCKTKSECVDVTRLLITAGIVNLDLGAFQINYRSHKIPLPDYFEFLPSYEKACSYVQENIHKYGFGWFAIASYHSQTEKFNYKYQRNLITHYFAIKNKDKKTQNLASK